MMSINKVLMMAAIVFIAPFSPAAGSKTLVGGESIADAISDPAEYDEILLSAGTYPITARIVVDRQMTIRGIDGTTPEQVILEGNDSCGLMRLSAKGSLLAGVTLTKGKISSDVKTALEYGAAVDVSSGSVVSNCIFTANTLGGRAATGIISLRAANALVTHCRLTKNIFSRDVPWGSAIGLAILGAANPVYVRNTLIDDNDQTVSSKQTYGALLGCVAGATAWFVNCTIANNRVLAGSAAFGVYSTGSIKAVNAIVVGNTAKGAANVGTATWYNSLTDVAVSGAACTTVDTSIFTDFDNGIYLLHKDSTAAIDNGTQAVDSTRVEVEDTDFAGGARIVGEEVDIGCYEYNSSDCDITIVLPETDWWFEPFSEPISAVLTGDLGEAPKFYWDWTGDGVADAITDMPVLNHTFAAGSYPITVSASNATASAGVSTTLESPLVIHPRPLVTVAASDPAVGITAADIQATIDAAERGSVITIPKGVYRTAGEVVITVLKEVELRGETGKPEDVVILNNGTTNRVMNVDAGPHALVHSLTLAGGRGSGADEVKNKPFCSSLMIANRNGFDSGAGDTRPTAGLGGCVSNVVVRSGGDTGSKTGETSAVYLKGEKACFTHSVVSNCTSGAAWDAGKFHAVALGVYGGAVAENLLITGNASRERTERRDDTDRTAVIVQVSGAGSVLRWSTVVGNRGGLCGGVNVCKGGRFENCVIAGNKVTVWGDEPRYTVWSSIDLGENATITFEDKTKSVFPDLRAAEETNAAKECPAQVTNAVDVAGCLNETTTYGTTGQLMPIYRKGFWRLPKGSPAIDVVPAGSASAMPALDLNGRKRLVNGLYDLGAFELPNPCGLMLLFK